MQQNKVFQDENGQVKFDFTEAVDVFESYDLANLYSDYLSDVDFVIENEQEVIFLEYKNSAVKNASNAQGMRNKISADLLENDNDMKKHSFTHRLARKYYGTMWMVWACGKNPENKPIKYIFLLEMDPYLDSALKKRLEAKMMTQLPFKFENKEEIKHHIIGSFKVVDMKQWSEMYPQYPISYVN